MEQRIQEEQLEKMRLKAKNLEKVVIVLSVVMLLVYIAIGYLLATQENGIGILSGMKAVIFIAEIIFCGSSCGSRNRFAFMADYCKTCL